MLTFYEMDCLLRKTKKDNLRKNEANEDLAQRMRALLAKRSAQAGTPASPPPTGATPPAPAPVSEEPPVGNLKPSLAKQNLASAGTVGAGQERTPVKVIGGHDPLEPISPEAQAKRAKVGEDMAKRANQEGPRHVGRNQKPNSSNALSNEMPIEKLMNSWRGMAGSISNMPELKRLAKRGEDTSGMERKSDWAGKLQMALMKAKVPMIDNRPPSDGGIGPIPIGHPFALSFSPIKEKSDRSAINPNDLPVVIVTPALLKKAEAEYENLFGHRSDAPPADALGVEDQTARSQSLLGSFYPDYTAAIQGGDTATQELITRATQFVHLVYKNAHGLLDKVNTVETFAKRLGAIANAQRQGGEIAPLSDPAMDMQALIYLLNKSRENQDMLIRVGGGEGAKITPQTKIVFLDPAGKWKPEEKIGKGANDERGGRRFQGPELRGPIAAPDAFDRAKEDELDPAALLKRHKYAISAIGSKNKAEERRRQKEREDFERQQQQQQPPAVESQQWADIYNLMEHWGF